MGEELSWTPDEEISGKALGSTSILLGPRSDSMTELPTLK